MRYQVRLGKNSFNVDAEKSSIQLVRQLSPSLWHLSYQNRSLFVTCAVKEWQITYWLNGEKVTAQIDEAGAPPVLSLAETTRGPLTIKSAMPGLVKNIEVQPGERVKKGQGLIILEAMKMENEIVSPADGTVQTIHVQEKQTVESHAPLLLLIR